MHVLTPAPHKTGFTAELNYSTKWKLTLHTASRFRVCVVALSAAAVPVSMTTVARPFAGALASSSDCGCITCGGEKGSVRYPLGSMF